MNATAIRPTVPQDGAEPLDVVIVGAGFAGLYALHRMRGLGLSARVFEAGSGVGGTWYWNRYPGARCDVESMEYSYKFDDQLQQEWQWTERYAAQPEILKYLNHVADRFDLRGDIRFNTRVTAAHFDEAADRWLVQTDAGDRLSARYCIMATGCLSTANLPQFEGLDRFKGQVFHTGRWPHEPVDFTGQKVAVIGTGSSAIQSIPLIAEQAAHLTVFQRTPNFSVPARNAPLDPAEQARVKQNYAQLREFSLQQPFAANFHLNQQSALDATPAEREAEYEHRWNTLGGLHFMGAYADLLYSKEANDTVAEFLRRKVRGIVKDPAVAEKLLPRDHVVGCKRLCSDTGYFETFNRPNVSLVDVGQTPIERITETGVVVDGTEYPVDAIVFATGFDAMTGSLFKVDLRGRNGLRLQDKWSAGPRTLLGLATSEFPNLFIITGPGSPSVLSNMVMSIEEHVDWVSLCIEHMQSQGYSRIEPSAAAEDAWVEHVNEVGGSTLFPTCNSWYLGANVPGKPRVFMPYVGFAEYTQKLRAIAAQGYRGFVLAKPQAAARDAGSRAAATG